MHTNIQWIVFGTLVGLTTACGGGFEAQRNGEKSHGISDVQEVNYSIHIDGTGEGFNLQASPVATIYAQRLNFTADCTDGGGSVTEAFMALGSDSGSTNFTANFTTTIPSYCDTASLAVVSLVGKFDNATTGLTFTLNAAAASTTYRSGGWSVHASLNFDVGPPAKWVALFEFDKYSTNDTDNDALTARETINGTVTVEVNDRCAGAAAITPDVTSSTSFDIAIPHTLTSAQQWTEILQDDTLAVSPYTENGADVAGEALWTFDFDSATVTDLAVQYRLTVNGTANMSCIALVSFAVTATDGTPTTIP